MSRMPAFAPSCSPVASRGGTVLIATTTWWAFPARIAAEFLQAGCRVEAIGPSGQPMRKVAGIRRLWRYGALRPLHLLRRAIEGAAPDLIIPCDDRAVEHLHQLHASLQGGPVAAAIARSLGDPAHFATVLDRARFIGLARAAGVRAPEMVPVPTPRDLGPALGRVRLPAVLKTDRTWGGLGTRIVRSAADAQAAWRAASRPVGTARMLKRLIVDRDPFHILPWLRRARAPSGLQAMVSGRAANCIAACRNGAVLSLTSVEVLASSSALGAATIVRVIDHPGIADAARKLARMLGLSGICGFDFLIDEETGAAELLEINPRATPLCHLNLGAGQDPVGALAADMTGRAPVRPPVTSNPIIAYFPQAWHKDPAEPLLRRAYHDLPWDDPALARELIRLPRPDRGVLARLVRAVRQARVAVRAPQLTPRSPLGERGSAGLPLAPFRLRPAAPRPTGFSST